MYANLLQGNNGFTLTHQIFSVHRDTKNLTTSHQSFWICAWGKLGQELWKYLDYCNLIVFEKLPFQIPAGVLKFSRFKERFRKDSFSWQISVDGRPNRRNKALFWNFFQRIDDVWDIQTDNHFPLLVKSEKKWKSEAINVPLVKPLIAKLLLYSIFY